MFHLLSSTIGWFSHEVLRLANSERLLTTSADFILTMNTEPRKQIKLETTKIFFFFFLFSSFLQWVPHLLPARPGQQLRSVPSEGPCRGRQTRQTDRQEDRQTWGQRGRHSVDAVSRIAALVSSKLQQEKGNRLGTVLVEEARGGGGNEGGVGYRRTGDKPPPHPPSPKLSHLHLNLLQWSTGYGDLSSEGHKWMWLWCYEWREADNIPPPQPSWSGPPLRSSAGSRPYAPFPSASRRPAGRGPLWGGVLAVVGWCHEENNKNNPLAHPSVHSPEWAWWRGRGGASGGPGEGSGWGGSVAVTLVRVLRRLLGRGGVSHAVLGQWCAWSWILVSSMGIGALNMTERELIIIYITLTFSRRLKVSTGTFPPRKGEVPCPRTQRHCHGRESIRQPSDY